MIHYVAGMLTAVGEKSIVVDHQGLGLEILVPASVLQALPVAGSDVKVYTYFHVKEDGMQLFGFLSRQDKELFQQLITVNGIGPKGGLAMMSTLSSDDIRMAILSDDAKTIATTPGIGPKTAKKLILELKDKIDLESVLPDAPGQSAVPGRGGNSQAQNDMVADTVDALTALGYSPTDAMRAVRAVPLTEDMTVEELLKLTLKNM
ncbi:MAG: Holliday junction branch migration protein RuvA [Lachnospiraceae bacterium]|nr:Holliday junction branch migration protein RuvA [Lachnospiraceae bacterium]